MCGIAGLICPGLDHKILDRMTDTLTHRGPDDRGVYVNPDRTVGLGQRRLSIIDLSPRGHQPMCNERGDVWVVFNGEIYNFPVLRKELEAQGHVFSSDTDTETIIHAYEQWGTNCVEQFRGMFAFAVWDEGAGRLFLARDRVGIKPLFYYARGDCFAFGSELKAIVENPNIPRKVDWDSVGDYLSYGYVPGEKCVFRDFKKLPPAHCLVYERGKISVNRYWEVEYEPRRDTETLIGEITDELARSVEMRLVSDVPLGIFLSGGIDSSLVTGFAARASAQAIKTFSIGFDVEEHNELGYAREVSGFHATEHQEKTVKLEDAASLLDSIGEIYDEPNSDSSIVPTYILSQFTRQSVTVALSGDGGDELFAGYLWYFNTLARQEWAVGNPVFGALFSAMARNLRFLAPVPKARALVRIMENKGLDPIPGYFNLIGFFNREEKFKLMNREARVDSDHLWLFRKYFRKEYPLLTALQYLDFHTYLPDDILVKTDRASMRHALEVRVPILDHNVVKLAFQVQSGEHYKDNQMKSVLKRAAREVLPPAIMNRPKQGFSVPQAKWHDWFFSNQGKERILSGSLVENGLINRRVLEAQLPAMEFSRTWLLLTLENWFKRWAV